MTAAKPNVTLSHSEGLVCRAHHAKSEVCKSPKGSFGFCKRCGSCLERFLASPAACVLEEFCGFPCLARAKSVIINYRTQPKPLSADLADNAYLAEILNAAKAIHRFVTEANRATEAAALEREQMNCAGISL